MRHLGIEEPALNSFSFEFLEGMAPARAAGTPVPRRTNILGDLEDSSPEFWDWGGWNEKTRDVDGLLMLFAVKGKLEPLIEAEKQAMRGIADGEPIVLRGQLFPPDMKEHFGFADGLSQPKIEGPAEKTQRQIQQGQIRDQAGLSGRGGRVPAWLQERAPGAHHQRAWPGYQAERHLSRVSPA